MSHKERSPLQSDCGYPLGIDCHKPSSLIRADRSHVRIDGFIKLDYLKITKEEHLAGTFSGINDHALFIQKSIKVNLSGAGVKFKTTDLIKVGDLLDIRMILPGAPFHIIHAVGRVVRIGSPKRLSTIMQPASYVAIKFVAIDEDDRDTIVKCVFTWQRKILRVRKMSHTVNMTTNNTIANMEAKSLFFH